MSEVRRPILITLLGILYVLGAIVILALGAVMLILGSKDPSEFFQGDTLAQILQFLSDNNLTWGQLTQYGGIGMIVMGILFIIVAVGLLRGWLLFWALGLIVNLLGLIGSIYMFTQSQVSGTLIPMVINILIVAYMLSPGVRRFFFD